MRLWVAKMRAGAMIRESLVLGIESSLRRDGRGRRARTARDRARACVRGQDAVHAPYGGVVPELASRDHVRACSQVVEAALAEAGVALRRARRRRRDGRARASLGSLLVGALASRKALAYRRGHPARRRAPPGRAPRRGRARRSRARAAVPRARRLGRPHGALPHRGGGAGRRCSARRATTRSARRSTRSRSCSGSRIPGGPALARLAERATRRAFAFPRPLAARAGLRLLVQRAQDGGGARAVRRRGALDERGAPISRPRSRRPRPTCSSRRRAAPRRATKGSQRLAVVGGVAANRRLRRELAARGASATASRCTSRRSRSAPTTPR